MNLLGMPPRPRHSRARLLPIAVLLFMVAGSCSSNEHLTSPATDPGVYGTAEMENHVPASGALVLVESSVDPIAPVTSHDFFASIRSVPDGGFGTGPVPAGQYAIMAGYARLHPNPGATFDSLISYEVVTVTDASSNRIPMRLTLRPPATIEGRLETGTPWVKYVYAVGIAGQVSGTGVDANGRFAIEGVPQGTWRIMIYDFSGATGVLDKTIAGIVTRSGQTTRVPDVQVPPP